MKIKHYELAVPEANPFQFCVLGREKYAQALMSMVMRYKNGFVLSINNPWGTGKTTFIKMWQGLLNQHSFRTLYFNAWENDFDSDPLVAVISELKSLKGKKNEKLFKSVVQKAAVISKNIAPALIKALLEKHLDSQVLLEAMKGTAEGAVELFKEEVDEYAKKKQGLVEFRTELEKYIDASTDGKPLIFIIDELDRCRPDYAVQVLEQVKHFFNVPGIVFVLSIDKVQLGNAVRGFYGSESINSNEYLRRFIDAEFSLPAPDKGVFTKYLYKYFNFDDYFNAKGRENYREIQGDGNDFIRFSALLFSSKDLTLRQQEKVFSSARLVLNTFEINHFLYPSVFLMLIYMKDFFPEVYAKLLLKNTPFQEILDGLAMVFPKQISEDDFRAFLLVEVHLLMMYQNSLPRSGKGQQLSEKDAENKERLLVKSNVDKRKDGEMFLNFIENIKNRHMYSTSINHLTDRINLMENFVSGDGLP